MPFDEGAVWHGAPADHRSASLTVESLLRLVGLDWKVPDFSTLSRRQKSLPLAVAIRFTEAMGLTRLGYRGPLREVGENLLHEAGEAGFAVLRTGPEAFAAELHKLQSDPLQSIASHQQDLRPLLQWLSGAGDTDLVVALRDRVREHIFRNYPIDAGTLVLGRPCPRTYVYSITSAKRAFRMARPRLNRKLVASGYAAPTGSPDRVILLLPLRSEEIDPLLSPSRGWLTRAEAIERLGASEAVFRQLRHAKIIRKSVEPPDLGPRYALSEIDGFLNGLLASLPRRSPNGQSKTHLPLTAACAKIGTSLLDVSDLIRAGTVRSAAVDPEGHGLAAIHLDATEVRHAVLARMTEAVPKLKAARILNGPLRMVDYLLATGELELCRRGPSLRGHTMPAVTHESLDRFLAGHTTLGRLSKALGLSYQRLRVELPRNGIIPVPVPKGTGGIYVKTGLVEKILASELDLPGRIDISRM